MLSTCAMRPASVAAPDWQGSFLPMLPAIEAYANRAFRRLSAQDREEAIQAVVALAAVACARLFQQQKTERIFATPLARFAVKQYRAGRLVGGKSNCRDVGSTSCRRQGCIIDSLNDWEDALCNSRRPSPAEFAALRIDLADWLSTLTRRDRQVAGAFASGESNRRVAEMFQLTAGRVSQIRSKLHDSWRQFVGEAAPA